MQNLPSDEHRFLLASTLGSCNATLGVQLWNEMIQGGHVNPKLASQCKSCWAFVMVAHARAGNNLTEQFESLQLATHSPYRHAQQVPPMVNTKLLTEESQPFRNAKEDSVCQVLESFKADILQEYKNYRQAVQDGQTNNLHETNHRDVTLSE